MIIIKNDNLRPFDVDGTLILHLNKEDLIKYKTVKVWDAVSKSYLTFGVHEPMIRLLKEEFHRGNYIEVWSRGGWEWAKNVIIALDIQKYVHQVKTKPLVYFDDTPVKKWLKDRVFIDSNQPYKGVK